MIDAKLIGILRCPIDGAPLHLAAAPLIESVNQAIARAEARDRAEQLVTEGIEGGLVTGDEKWLYPIRDSIPTLLADEAISLEGLE